MKENHMNDWSDPFPEMPKTDLPIHTINKQFKFHNPISANSTSTVPRMANADWCKRVLNPDKRDKCTESTKYETNENYLICMYL